VKGFEKVECKNHNIDIIWQHGSNGLENKDEGSCGGTIESKRKLVRDGMRWHACAMG